MYNEHSRLTAEEAAAYLRVSVGRLHNLCSEGKLSYSRPAKRSFFRIADLNAYLDQNKVMARNDMEAEAERHLAEMSKRRETRRRASQKANN